MDDEDSAAAGRKKSERLWVSPRTGHV